MTTVLVTGATGLFGSCVVPYLLARGHKVISHSRAATVGIRADLSVRDQAQAALDQAAPDVILNLAGLTNVDECEEHPQKAYLANVKVVENLAEWIRMSGSSCFLVHLSTDQVYDGAGRHSEQDVTLTNYYAFSKYAGERAALTVPGTVMRTNFFGPSRCEGRSSLSDWLVRSLRGTQPVTVFDDVRFSPLSMQRLSELTELAIVRRQRGLFNVGSRNAMSKAEFAFALAGVLRLPTDRVKKGSVKDMRLRAYRPRNMGMDSTSFERCFGVELPDLETEIRSMKEAYAHVAG